MRADYLMRVTGLRESIVKTLFVPNATVLTGLLTFRLPFLELALDWLVFKRVDLCFSNLDPCNGFDM